MMSSLDDLLRQQARDEATSATTLARVKAELAQPRHSWRRDALRLVVAWWAMACGLTTVLLLTGNTSPDLVLSRLASVAPLMVLGGLGGYFAIAPGGQRWRGALVVAFALAMLAIVVTRGAGHPSAQPEWVCTLSHLSLGAGPLGVAMLGLRRTAPNVMRSMVAGLAIGTVGAIAGEVGCDQGWQHVMVFHLVPWAALTAVAVLVSRRMKRWSYAP